jgi:CYTH domain-containing protein
MIKKFIVKDHIGNSAWYSTKCLSQERVADNKIDKTRNKVEYADGTVWTVDVFSGDNQGLEIAELEVEKEAYFDKIVLPQWLGVEVTEDERFSNLCLSENPFKNWWKNLYKELGWH